MVKIKGIKVYGIAEAAHEWQAFYNNPGWRVELWFNPSDGRVWAKPMTQNSWTEYADDRIVNIMPCDDDCYNWRGDLPYDTYKGKIAFLRKAIGRALR